MNDLPKIATAARAALMPVYYVRREQQGFSHTFGQWLIAQENEWLKTAVRKHLPHYSSITSDDGQIAAILWLCATH